MSNLSWNRENPAYWDDAKAEIVGKAPEGTFPRQRFDALGQGDVVPGEWWRVQEGGEVVGYGWMDLTWGDAEILLAVAPSHRGHGVGSFILDSLARAAAERGINYLYNVIPDNHPDADELRAWLEKRQFSASEDGKLMRGVALAPSRAG